MTEVEVRAEKRYKNVGFMFKKFPIILAIISQLVSAFLVYLLNSFFHFSFFYTISFYLVFVFLLSKILGLKKWWIFINLIFLPAIVFLNQFHVSPFVFLIGFVIVLLLNWNSFRERVPLYLTDEKTILKLKEILSSRQATEKKDSFTFVDLGSGLANTLLVLSKHFPQAQFEGVETAPLVFLISYIRCSLQKNCRIRYQNIWQVDLSAYDVVYCFLSPVPMPKIWQKAKAEMKKKSLLISNTFIIPGAEPSQEIDLQDWRQSKLYIWHL